MRWMAIAAVLAVGCGGRFEGDKIIAEIRDGRPYCSPGASGPTITQRVGKLGNADGTTRDGAVTECDWTCAETLFPEPGFAYATFYQDEAGRWVVNRYDDPDPARASCPK